MVFRANSALAAQRLPRAKALGKNPIFEKHPFPYVRNLLSILPEHESEHGSKRIISRWLRSQLTNIKTTQRKLYRRYGRCLWKIRAELFPRYLRTYTTNAMIQEHRLLSFEHCNEEHYIDPLTLIKEIRQADSDNPTEKRRAHMAMCDLEDALSMLWLTSDERHPFVKRNQEEIIEEDQEDVLSFLRDLGFITGTPAEISIRSVHNKHAPYKCIGVLLGDTQFVSPRFNYKPRHRLSHHVLVMLTSEHGPIPALLYVRRKGIMQTLTKLQTSGVGNPKQVPDRRGIRFLFRNKEEMAESARYMLNHLPHVRELKWHVYANDPPINQYADPQLPLIKATIWIGDKLVEVQWMLATDHVDLRYSTDEKNTVLYHRRCLTAKGGRLELYRPRALFGIDWNDKKIQTCMDNHILASVKR